ncbi:polyribonucleotide nucleotidyltransferase [Candidatus Daviesbacteria bacterium]|nr:polyribonucleotide nucleotidyltransferase [Candidatus Daviesbacteria bacterium]
MDKKIITKEIELNGKKIKLETGKLAQQTEAAVVASLGETVVLATVATQPILEDPGYFPLSVEYVEKYYAGGRITAQKFIKRETRPSEKAILAGRAIDRSIRPLFPKDFRNEVQVIITVLSFDGVNDPATLGFIGTSAALAISSIPWAGPIGVSRIGERDDNLVINPDLDDIEHLDLDLIVASTKEKVIMIEAEADQVEDGLMFNAIKKGFEESQPVIKLIEEFMAEAAKPKQSFATLSEQVDEKILAEAKKVIREKIEAELFDTSKAWHDATGDFIKREIAESYSEQLTGVQISAIFDKVAKEIMNDTILNKGKRVDGRAMDEVRPIYIETGVLPRTHGSAIFQRGDTQVLSIATLGPLSAAQTLEGMEGESSKRFMHHYNMSINPFASGEVKRLAAPNRRDIGHGDLVERSILAVLPDQDDFPYAIRVVSEVLASNASTSQAAVCSTTLALLNAGVPIEPVAGIALGLLSNDQKFQVITDMQAVEDFYGEMDFKVAGTLKGITGIQMDTKLHGLTFEIIEEALSQGRKAREMILGKIKEAAPKEAEISQYAPKIEVTHIKPEEIGMLIGPGGKNINSIIAKTGAQIDIEDDGTVMISSTDEESIKKALASVEGMFKKVEIGEEYDGKVVRLAPFGAFVEILPGKDGLVHVSQMAPSRVEDPADIVSEGQAVHVRVIDVDHQGKIALSMLFGEDRKPETEHRRRVGPVFDRNSRGESRFNRLTPSRGRGGRGGRGFGR